MNNGDCELLNNLAIRVKRKRNKLMIADRKCREAMRRMLSFLDGSADTGREIPNSIKEEVKRAIDDRELAENSLNSARRELSKAVDLTAKRLADERMAESKLELQEAII